MLNSKAVIATIAVKDLDKAKIFYEGKLGLKSIKTDGKNYISYKSGPSNLLVYQSEFAGNYKATVATWSVGNDIESIVKDLRAKGVLFEHYIDMPHTTLKGDIHIMGDMKNAWAKDQDGNIHCFVNADFIPNSIL